MTDLRPPAPVTSGPASARTFAQTLLPDPPSRYLTEADGRDIARRLTQYASGQGLTGVIIASTWRGSTRWARNLVSLGSDVRSNHLSLGRDINGAQPNVVNFNDTSDAGLVAALRRAERLLQLVPQQTHKEPLAQRFQEVAPTPQLFSDATYQFASAQRAAVVPQITQGAVAAGMLSAGYLEVAAHSLAFLTSFGVARYEQWTTVQYSVTVRDPKGVGSGWAGVDHWDWGAIDAATLSAIALDKCLKSRNPVAVEPGRYTTILEPQAVAALVKLLVGGAVLSRFGEITEDWTPFNVHKGWDGWNSPQQARGESMLGQKVVDERITISADPMDPALKFPSFGLQGGYPYTPFNMMQPPVYHGATWIKNGVLNQLAYNLPYGEVRFGKSTGLPASGALRMSGGTTSIEEMIQTTKRGLLVTRFDRVDELNGKSLLCRGYTRDGLWLIENGKIAKAVKNMAFTESTLFALNNIEQLGVPQRVFNPELLTDELMWFSQYAIPMSPIIVPPLKVKDFSFTALSDAI